MVISVEIMLKYVFFLIVLAEFSYSKKVCKDQGHCAGKLDRVHAPIEKFPYSASLLDNPSLDYVCSGAILSKMVVVTAASCIYKTRNTEGGGVSNFRKLHVTVGSDDLFPNKKKGLLECRCRIVHECYNHTNYINDIGLLILKQGLKFGPKVNKVTIVDNFKAVSKELERSKSRCNVTGWGGKYLQRIKKRTHFLKFTTVKVYKTRKCCSIYNNQGWSWRDEKEPANVKGIHAGYICAGERYKMNNTDATLLGDIGGALVVPGNIQIGLLSHIKKVNGSGLIGIFTNLTYHYAWIMNETDFLKGGNRVEY